MKINRILLIVLDSVGCGDAPDAAAYADLGSNTLSNISKAIDGLNLPQLESLGLGKLTDILGVSPDKAAKGVYGRLTEVSAGKDTTTGHWELGGIVLQQPFPTYPNGFPKDLMTAFEAKIGHETLGNYPASGTEIIKDLGEEHLNQSSIHQPTVFSKSPLTKKFFQSMSFIKCARLPETF